MKESFDREALGKLQWATLSEQVALDKLGVSKNGLSNEEAAERLAAFGENKLPEGKKDGALKRFLKQFHNALIYVLLGAAVLTGAMALFDDPSHWLDTGVILGVVIINSIVGFVQEDKAKKALDSIKNLLSLKATALREGRKREVAAETLVLGDMVYLKAGDKVPADLRLVEVSRLEVDESALTGESLAVLKTTKAVKPDTVLGERESMAYAGTTVRTGDAWGVVVASGADTEVGKINTMLTETKSNTTPLMKKIGKLGTALSVMILSFSTILALYAIFFRNMEWAEAITAVIGLAVAAIPEGLPAIITIALAIGVQRMAKKNAIVRRLPSVETLGSVTVICSDKTGTLTKNEMTATNIYTADGDFEVSGLGYAPEGEVLSNGKRTDYKNPALLRLVQSAYLCNEAEVFFEKNQWFPQGAPTEAALKTLARKAGFADTDAKKINDIPFDSEYKYRAALYQIENKNIIFVVGAPERLFALCAHQISGTKQLPLDTKLWETKITKAAGHGQRLLGTAFLEVDNDKISLEHIDLKQLTFAGIVGIIDPPRPEAIESIRICKTAGIRVKMITGDHVLTAREIARQMGIVESTDAKVFSGAELEAMDDAQIREAAISCNVFARTTPEHKLRLVKALQESGEIVAMTGDGVNDAPALKKADIGVAMGIKGTEVTKDSAAMVLADDNFSSIVSAVKEGRTIYDNIKKTLLFILPTNAAEALVIVAAILFHFALPITAVQILWVNMVTAVTLALSLAFEPAEKQIMQRPPRNPKEPLVGGYFIFRILFVAIIATLLTTAFFLIYERNGYDIAYARALAVNMLVLCEMVYLFNCRKLHKIIFSKDFFKNKIAFIVSGILILIQIGFTYLPFMQSLFGVASLRFIDWLYLIAGGIALLLIVETEKLVADCIKKHIRKKRP